MIRDFLLIGAGGTGAALAPHLARLIAYHRNASGDLHIWDGDDYEARNADRQPVPGQTVLPNKAIWMQNLCQVQGLNNVIANADYANQQSIQGWLDSHANSVIICAVDNNATRKAALEALQETKSHFLFVTPGNADASEPSNPIRGQVFYWARSRDGEFGFDPRRIYTEIDSPGDPIPELGSCSAQAPSAPQLLASNLLAAAWTFALIQNHLDGTLPPAEHNHAVFFNGRSSLLATRLV